MEVDPSPMLQLQAPVAVVLLVNTTHKGAHPVVSAGPTFSTGKGFTVTTAVSAFAHPLMSVPVTIYVAVLVGLALTVEPEVPLKPAAGDQAYVLAPAAFKLVAEPLQMLAELTEMEGSGFMVTVQVPAL